ncbi:PREDICTED: eukaryotic translation initiation factor 2D isoform X2 [Rhagoletis zephyria]|uniref:eukaryotic translation initiation factor 2D isoform X1 n=1 Tax=Rhagoletis zephyria TaxID=28612 RepID=UPI0008113D6A|nr:PREDICTED: eukaryotic translation initiation factor 2D isoform X1 [Rhagoletis zephyria]XP_017483707.1 PREDICTED: eukaryotic translation initiation factor 2D isoform X2 [Rhagoletis zephyria]
MFLKPYKLRSNAPLKGSESKRLRQRVENTFPDSTPEEISILIPSKSAVTQLKLTTHGGMQTNVFCVDKLPMFFELESGELAPTLYALWLVSTLLPYFTTFRDVLPKLSNGADLMLPGVVPKGTGMNMYGRYRQGQLMAVNLVSNESAVAVGYLPRSSDDLYMCGRQGVAVKMLHIFGDKLWGHEPTLVQQVPLKKATPLTTDDFPELGAKEDKQKQVSEKLTLADIVAATNLSETPVAGTKLPDVQNLKISENDVTEDVKNVESITKNTSVEGSATTPEIILKNAFLAALKNHGKTLQLPLLTSNFYRLYVVPEAPQPIDLKKTKYKKLSNFLNEMIDEGFIVVREESKGVDKITAIDLDHPELVNFITDFKPTKQPTDGELQDQPLFRSELTETYIITDATAPFFAKVNYKRGEAIPTAQIKKIVREYISKHNLPKADPSGGTIQLDETLERICDVKTASVSQICGTLTRKMEYSFQMCELKSVAANKPLIQMSLATRSGNKKVTLISNVECYGIIVPEFIKLCKQGAAASTTVVKLPHQKAEQLQIQGNQVRFVYNLLTETYKVPPKCILGLELAKDGKKHKKK